MIVTQPPTHARPSTPSSTIDERRRAAVVRPVYVALSVLAAWLVGTLAVSGSDRVDSGWSVARPSTALDRVQPADPKLRIAINQVLEHGQVPLLLSPAPAPVAMIEPPSSAEVDADGWRPARISDELPVDAPAPPADVLVLTDPTPPLAEEAETSVDNAIPLAEPSTSVDAPATPIEQPAPRTAKPSPLKTLTIEAATPLPTSDESKAIDATDQSAEEEPAKKNATRVSAIGPPEVGDNPPPPLTKQLQALRTRMRRVLKSYYNRPLNSRDNDPWEMMHGMLAYGIHSRVRQGGPQGKLITSVGWLCYNKPCKNMTLLYATKQGELRAKYGVGLQGHMGQFLAMLAQCQVSPDYPIRVGKREYTVNELIEAEKVTCYSKSELTFKLISLMHYCESDTQWVNDQGVRWDIPKLIREELSQPIRGAACGGTHRLSGLSLATRTRVRRDEPLDGEYLRAAEFVDKYHKYAFQMQNRDGSLSTSWFRGRGSDPDTDRRVKTTGHILEWLCYSLPDEQLHDARTFRAVSYLTNLLGSNYNHEWEVGPVSHALHALKLYDERVFQPYDTQQEIVAGPGKRQTAKRPMNTSSRTQRR